MTSPRLLREVPFGTNIPRIVHQVFPTFALPSPIQVNVEKMCSANPGWTFRLYDDEAMESYIEEQYGTEVLAYYLQIDPSYGAARADLFRYLAIYREGGVYLDSKSTFSKPIDEVLDRTEAFIISRWRSHAGGPHAGFGYHGDLAGVGEEIQQWHVIAAPGHPFLRAVIKAVLKGIDDYGPRRTGVGRIGVLRLTGPIAYTRAIMPLLNRYPCKVISNETEISLQYSVLEGMNHQSLFTKHYSTKTSPIVVRKGLRRAVDLLYIRVRNIKRKMQGREY